MSALTVTVPLAADADITVRAPDGIDAAGIFGFVGVDLALNTDVNDVLYPAEFSLNLAESELTLTELFNALGDADGDELPGTVDDITYAVDLPLFDVVPLDVSLVHGSHGLLSTDQDEGPMLIADDPDAGQAVASLVDLKAHALRRMGLAD